MLIVCAISDKRNGPPPAGMNPLVIFLAVFALGACLGAQTAYAINPARDLGPRLMAYMVGYGPDVWNYRSQYWLWCPILGSIAGGMAGTAVYDLLIFEGEESIMNRPYVFCFVDRLLAPNTCFRNAAARRRHAHAPSDEKKKPVAGADSV
jgi:aquaglyceroporin related protein